MAENLSPLPSKLQEITLGLAEDIDMQREVGGYITMYEVQDEDLMEQINLRVSLHLKAKSELYKIKIVSEMNGLHERWDHLKRAPHLISPHQISEEQLDEQIDLRVARIQTSSELVQTILQEQLVALLERKNFSEHMAFALEKAGAEPYVVEAIMEKMNEEVDAPVLGDIFEYPIIPSDEGEGQGIIDG